ncbi:hypothetical protein NMG60_11029566 [Bertholletia excelsa]
MYGHRQTLAYLLKFTSNNIESYIALDLVKKFPRLATSTFHKRPTKKWLLSPLETLAKIPSAFRRGCKLKYWEGLIYDDVEIFPDAIFSIDKDEHPVFHLAVVNRCENVLNLAYRVGGHNYGLMNKTDNNRNTVLHLAGRLAKPQKLNLVSGAALQMQRELQWFKEVERWVIKDAKERTNKVGKTPQMIFTEEHKNLVIEGEKWMRDTANSCASVASLNVTIVFATAITVPGGINEDNGQPVLFKRNAFLIFAISDAISLFSSTASLLMFLAILTTRYAEINFLHALPKKLFIGLVTLFNWVLTGVAILAFLPVTLFVFLQFPLLVDLISSTYGPDIFGKRSDRPFY